MINQSHTDALSHRRAQKLIQQGQLSPEAQNALKSHFERCEECRRYAAVHVYLLHHLQLKPVRTYVPPEIMAAILRRVESQHRRGQIMKPIHALAGLVILAIVVFAVWQVISNIAPQSPQPAVEGLPATVLVAG